MVVWSASRPRSRSSSFDIAERERVPKVPAHSTENQLGLGLSPLEDRRSDWLLHDLVRLPGPPLAKVATHPLTEPTGPKLGSCTTTVNLATTSGRFLSPSVPPIPMNPITNAVQGLSERGYADG